MKVVVGFGHNADGQDEIQLLSRLKFKDLSGAAVRVVESYVAPFFSTHAGLSQDAIERYIRDEEIFHRAELDKVISFASDRGVILKGDLRQGQSAARGILDATKDLDADLIVTGSKTSGRFGRLLNGSVTRKLAASSPKSLLVARNVSPGDGGLNAVFATDHSNYVNSCLDVLLRFAPRGIAKLTVMTAYPKVFFEQVMKFQGNFKGNVGEWMESELEKQNAKVIEKLMPLGCPIDSIVFGGDVEDAIESTLEKCSAELLILGSQGHGFLERVGAGSVSFDQVVSGQSSVLLLRAPNERKF